MTPAPAGVRSKSRLVDPPMIACELHDVGDMDTDDDDEAVEFFEALAFVTASRDAGVCGEEDVDDEVDSHGDRKTVELRRAPMPVRQSPEVPQFVDDHHDQAHA
jgi:hypothetical protein